MRAPIVATKVLRDPVELRPEPKSEPKPELEQIPVEFTYNLRA